MPSIIKPTGYGTLPPPKKGGSYLDSVLPTPVKRLTDAIPAGYSNISIEYSTVCPWNADNSRFLGVSSDGHFIMYDSQGMFINNLPAPIVATSEPRWSKDPTKLYYVSGNALYRLSLSNGSAQVVHRFTGFNNIYGQGESDLSEDGDHIVLSAGATTDTGLNRTIFIYEISTDISSQVIQWPRPFNNLYITPDNNILVGDETGVTMLSHIPNTNIAGWQWKVKQVAQTQAHQDVTRDANGDEVLIRTNAADNPPLTGCNNGIEMVRLKDGLRTCLLPIGWSPRGGAASLSVHISCSDNGKILVSTEAPSNPTIDQWEPYTNELILLDVKSTAITRLAHHRSQNIDPNDHYIWQPKASISRDGTIGIFNSNWGQPLPGYADMYSLSVPKDPSPAPVPPSPPITNPLAGWRRINYKPGAKYLMVGRADGGLDIYEEDK